jgi:hypothetical protein
MTPKDEYQYIEYPRERPDTPPRRNHFRFVLVLLLVTAAVGALFAVVWREMTAVGTPVPAFAVSFKSKGANSFLTKEWFVKHAGLSKNAVTLPEIEEKLKRVGQIKRVLKISRRFADSGVDVEVEERNPVLKIKIPATNGQHEIHLIGDDGVVYKGINYGDLFIARLPELADAVPVVGKNDEIQIPGVANVIRLLARAKQHNANFHLFWEGISVREFKEGRADLPGAHIHVRMCPNTQSPNMAKINELIFSADISKMETQFAIYSAPAFRARLARELRAEPDRSYDLRLYLENKTDHKTPYPEPRLTPTD